MIQMGDDGVVLAPVKADRIRRAREGSERFVAPEGIRTDVKGMFRKKVRRDFDLFQRIKIEVFLRGLAWIVRRIEADIGKERRIAGCWFFRKKLDDAVGVQGA